MANNKHIGLLRETALHAAIKAWYFQAGDLTETPLDGYLIDILRGGEIIEIQTGHFSAIKPKLHKLLDQYRVRLVYPVAVRKWLLKWQPGAAQPISRKPSPRRGRLEDVFSELVRIPQLIMHPNLVLDILLVEAEEDRLNDGQGSWRRAGWSIGDRRLLRVLSLHSFEHPADFARLLPEGLPPEFTTAHMAALAKMQPYLAHKMAYCLRNMEIIELIGKSGRANLYRQRGSD